VRRARAVLVRVAALFRGRRAEQELADELEGHLELHTAENVRAGMTPAEARRAALVKLGGVEATKEACRERRTLPWIEVLRQDVRYGLRGFRRSPAFAAVVVGILAVGIGANTALFTAIDAMLLRGLPYADADRLVMIWKRHLKRGLDLNLCSPTNFADWQARTRSFASMGAIQNVNVNLTGAGDPTALMVQRASAGVLPTLGVAPMMGRYFTAAEDAPGTPHVVVLTYWLWNERFGADPGILGRAITLDGGRYTVIGVMPAGFTFLNRQVAAWAPLNLDPAARWKDGYYLRVVARLRPGVAAAEAVAELDTIAAQEAQEAPATETGWDISLQSVRDHVTGGARRPLVILGAAMGCVLWIACAIIGGLLLARGMARARETAIRISIGASRWRIASQHFVESLMLASAGGIGGVVLAFWGTRLLDTAIPDTLRTSTLGTLHVNAVALGFAIVATMATGVLCGLAPALAGSHQSVYGVLRRGAGDGASRVRRGFVVVQTALALTLLSGAGLMARSLANLYTTPLGVQADHILTLRAALPARDEKGFFEEAVERVRALPGVRSAAAVDSLPLGGMGVGTYLFIEGQPDPPHGSEPIVQLRSVTPRYFETLQIPLRAGHDFTERDNTRTAPRAYILSEMAARRFFPNENPVGKKVSILWEGREPGQVVGVVGDVLYTGIDNEVMPTVYMAHAQRPFGGMNFVIRTAVPPMSVVAGVAAELRRMDRDLPLTRVRPLSAIVQIETSTSRFVMQLLMLLAGLALVLAASGLAGLLSYLVAQRRREIGIRVALGAVPRQVLGVVLREGVVLVGMGVASGVLLSAWAARLLGKLLHGVTATDPVTYVLVVLAVAAVAMMAMAAPARAAMKVDPAVTLRQE